MSNTCRWCGKLIPDGLKGNADYPHVCKRTKKGRFGGRR